METSPESLQTTMATMNRCQRALKYCKRCQIWLLCFFLGQKYLMTRKMTKYVPTSGNHLADDADCFITTSALILTSKMLQDESTSKYDAKSQRAHYWLTNQYFIFAHVCVWMTQTSIHGPDGTPFNVSCRVLRHIQIQASSVPIFLVWRFPLSQRHNRCQRCQNCYTHTENLRSGMEQARNLISLDH